MILIGIEVVYKIFHSVERFDLRHSELFWEREVQFPGCERELCLLYQSIHGDWSSSFHCFLHVAELLLDVPKMLLP